MSDFGDYQETAAQADYVRQAIDTEAWKLEELSLELTHKCLVRCIHCSSGSQARPMKDELNFQQHHDLMIQARKLGARVLSLSGGDPITLNYELLDYIGAGVELGFEKILLYTTGIWQVDLQYQDGWGMSPMSRGESNELATYGLAGLSTWPHFGELDVYADKGLVLVFSLHSHVPTAHDYIMKMQGSWRVITKGMNVAAMRGHTVWTHMVPMAPNLDHISKTRDLCVELGVDKMSLLRFVPQTRGLANAAQLDTSVQMFAKMQEYIDYEMTHPERRNLPCDIRAGCPADFRHAHEGTTIHGEKTGKTKTCHAGIDLMLVRPNGVVHPCAAWKSLPTDSNVREKTLAEIWDGDTTYRAIRTYLKEGYLHLKGACGTCPALDTCRGGCPAQRLHGFGRSKIQHLYYPEADPLCPTRLSHPDAHPENDVEEAYAIAEGQIPLGI